MSRSARALCAIIFVALAVTPLFASGRKRSVHGISEKLSIGGTVTDALTHLPLKGVTVISGEASSITDAEGQYALTCMTNATVTASRIGYVTMQKSAGSSIIDFALSQTPTVTVKTISGETFALDFATTKFGYVIVFQGYAAGDALNACKIGDPQWQPNKADMKKITGPARSVTSSCCDRGPVLSVDVEMKSGEKSTAYLNDNCFGYAVDVFGMERSSATAKYFHLTDVAEILFP